MKKSFSTLAALAALGAFGCEGSITEPDGAPAYAKFTNSCDMENAGLASKAEIAEAIATGEAPQSVSLGINIKGHSSVRNVIIQQACNMWANVECFETTYELADIRLDVDPSDCVPDEDGVRVLGMLHTPNLACGGMDITLWPSCFANEPLTPETEIEPNILRLVVAHEVGHALGMFDHIPATCDGADKDNPIVTDEDGTQICGDFAIMTPFINGAVTFETELDARHFNHRRTGFLFPTGEEGDLQASRNLTGLLAFHNAVNADGFECGVSMK